MKVNYFKNFTNRRTSTVFSSFEVQIALYYLSKVGADVTLDHAHTLFRTILDQSYSQDPKQDALNLLAKEINLGVYTFVEARTASVAL